MDLKDQSKVQESYCYCSPEKFAGRISEKLKLLRLIDKARDKKKGQAIMVSGPLGSGKSSFLDWADYEIQNELEIPTIRTAFIDPKIPLKTYDKLFKELLGHTKFGWFKKIVYNPKSKNTIKRFLEYSEKAQSVPVYAKDAAALANSMVNNFLDEDNLFESYYSVIRDLSNELKKDNQFLAIIVDDVQCSDEIGFWLLKGLIRTLPPRIILIISVQIDNRTIYNKLNQVVIGYGYEEISLSGMPLKDIKEFAKLKYDLSIDDDAANFLQNKIGYPLYLERCFDELGDLPPSLDNIQNIIGEIINPVEAIFSNLDPIWKTRMRELCILPRRLELSLIACMLEMNGYDMKNEVDQIHVLKKVDKEIYEFAPLALQKYCRDEQLLEYKVPDLHKKAGMCIETLKEILKESYDFSLADHYFFAKEFEKALELKLSLGKQLYNFLDYTRALQLTEQAKICAEETADNNLLAAAFNQKGMIYDKMDRFDKAFESYNESLKIKQEIGFRAGEAATLRQIGMVYVRLNSLDKALDLYNQSLKIEQEIGFRAGEAATLHQMGIAYQGINNFDNALDSYNKSLKIEREMGFHPGVAQTLHQMGIVYQDTNSFDKALEFYNKSLKIEREINYLSGAAKTLHQIGIIHHDRKSFGEALKFYKESLKIEREINHLTGTVATLHQIGIVFEDTEVFDQALDFYNQSLKVEQEIGFRAGEAKTLNLIGNVYEKKNNLDSALDFYSQSLKVEQEIGFSADEAKTLNLIGNVYEKKNNLDLALDNYIKSSKILRDIGDIAGEAQILHQIDMVYPKTNRMKLEPPRKTLPERVDLGLAGFRGCNYLGYSLRLQENGALFDMLDRSIFKGRVTTIMDKDQVGVPIERKVNLGLPMSEADAKRTTIFRVESDDEIIEHIQKVGELRSKYGFQLK